MKIVVMGAGGVGGYFGGLLAKSGLDVSFIARGAHLEAIRQSGLRVISDVSGEFVVNSNATDAPSTIGHADLVIYSVKMYHNADAIPAISPLIGPDTIILPLQNGIDNPDRLASVYGTEKVMIGAAFVQARVREPGIVEQLGQFGKIVFGERDGSMSNRAKNLLDTFNNGGWNVELTNNALRALWQKFIFLTATAGVNAVTQIPYGELRNIDESRNLIRSAYEEIAAVARASGASLSDDTIEQCMISLDSFPADGMASLAKDFAAGNPVELEGITGIVVRMGVELAIPTPINSALYALLKPAALRIEMARS